MPQYISHHRCHITTKSETWHNPRHNEMPVTCDCTAVWVLLTGLIITQPAMTSRRKHASGGICFLVAAGGHGEKLCNLAPAKRTEHETTEAPEVQKVMSAAAGWRWTKPQCCQMWTAIILKSGQAEVKLRLCYENEDKKFKGLSSA